MITPEDAMFTLCCAKSPLKHGDGGHRMRGARDFCDGRTNLKGRFAYIVTLEPLDILIFTGTLLV